MRQEKRKRAKSRRRVLDVGLAAGSGGLCLGGCVTPESQSCPAARRGHYRVRAHEGRRTIYLPTPSRLL